MTQTDAPTVDNGVNIEALRGARQALTDAPEAAQFQWRATTKWVNGTHSRSTITDFSGLGQQHAHRQAFTIEADHPQVFASEDNGATPPEIVLAALASCLTAGVATVATQRGRAAALGDGHRRGQWTCRASSGSTATCATASTRSTSPTTSTPTRRVPTSRRSSPSRQKRSAVFDIVTNPTTVHVALA